MSNQYFTFTVQELENALIGFPAQTKEQMLLNYYYNDVDSALELADFLNYHGLGGKSISCSPGGNFQCQVYLKTQESLVYA
jgi:hypothetical protein